MPIIEVNHVTKEFQLEELRSLKQTTLDAVARLRGHPVPGRSSFDRNRRQLLAGENLTAFKAVVARAGSS